MPINGRGDISAVLTQGAAKTEFEDLVDTLRQLPGVDLGDQELTISGGSITPALGSASIIRVDTESNAAADDLTAISAANRAQGSVLYLVAEDAARKVTVKDGAGIELIGGDFLLNGTDYVLALRRSLSSWVEVWRHYGDDIAGRAALRAWMGLAVGVDVQAFDADTAKLDVKQTWTAQQNADLVALVDGATISWDLDAAQNAEVLITGNRTLENPTNLVEGGVYSLLLKQDVTGGRTLSFGSNYRFPDGNPPDFSGMTASHVAILSFKVYESRVLGISVDQYDVS